MAYGNFSLNCFGVCALGVTAYNIFLLLCYGECIYSKPLLCLCFCRILAMQLINQRFAQGVDATEDKVQGMLETLNARMNGPRQIKVYIVFGH